MNPAAIYKTPEGEKFVQTVYAAQLARWPVPCETRQRIRLCKVRLDQKTRPVALLQCNGATGLIF